MSKKRLFIIDHIRAITIISMILYHFVYDLGYIFNYHIPFLTSSLDRAWQVSIGATFLFLSGFCFSLGSNQLKRGTEIFFVGLVVTLVTSMVLPDIRIIFGVMTCIGSCMLFTYFLDKYLSKIPHLFGFILFTLLFFICLDMNSGVIHLFSLKMKLPLFLYHDYFTTYLGFPFRGFYSSDYYAIFPWIFIYLSGYYTFNLLSMSDSLKFLEGTKNKFTHFLSSHSLEIYIIHQPIVFGLCLLIHLLIHSLLF